MRVESTDHQDVTLFPPAWDAPAVLPLGVTVAPAQDPAAAARRLADQVGAELVTTMEEAERALARQVASQRSFAVVREAAEATALAAGLEGFDAVADRRLVARAPELARQVEAGRTAAARAAEARAAAAALEEARAAETPLAAVAARARAAAAALESCPLASVDEADARAAAAAAVAAAARAAEAQEALGPRPDPGDAARAAEHCAGLVDDAGDALALAEHQVAVLRSRAVGAVVASVGLALVLAGAGVVDPAPAGLLPTAVAVSAAVPWRRRRAAVAGRARALAAATAERNEAADRHAAVALEMADWRARAEGQRVADHRLVAALRRWEALASPGADPDRVDELLAASAAVRHVAGDVGTATRAHAGARAAVAEAEGAWDRLAASFGLRPGTPPAGLFRELDSRQAAAAEAAVLLGEVAAAEARARARARLAEILHGRRLDRLQEEAARMTEVADEPARAIVLAEPFTGIGGGRRRAFLRTLERAELTAPVAVVTTDEEALAWAAARNGVEG